MTVGYQRDVVLPDLLILGGVAVVMVAWATFMFRFRSA